MTIINFPLPTWPEPPETPDRGKISRVRLTFPQAPVQYADDDAIGDGVLEFTKCCKVIGGAGLIVHVDMVQNIVAALALQAELWVFDEEPTSQFDNTPVIVTQEDQRHLVGVFPLGADACNPSCVFDSGSGYSGYQGSLYYQANVTASIEVSRSFRCKSGSKSLWGILVARSQYTPGPGEELNLNLHIVHGH